MSSTFALPALPYAYEALEPYIDSQTMNIHHTKHHQTYVTTINGALDKFEAGKKMSLVELNQAVGTSSIPDDIKTVVRNHGGGHWNHSFFWKVMGKASDNNGPSAALKAAIDTSFGSVDEMKAKFTTAAAGRFGSGWAWLGMQDGKLVITSTPNQDNPLMTQIAEVPCIPVLGLDVWEHAYYLKYQNRRPEYIANFWNVVNWEQVSTNFTDAATGKVTAV